MQTSYDKIRYTHTIEVAKSIVCYKETDLATFFIVQEDELSIIDKIWLRDLYNIILNEINQLPHPDNKIGKLAFIDELNDTQIAEVLHIPRTTVTYRKKIIQKQIQEKLKNLCQIE